MALKLTPKEQSGMTAMKALVNASQMIRQWHCTASALAASAVELGSRAMVRIVLKIVAQLNEPTPLLSRYYDIPRGHARRGRQRVVVLTLLLARTRQSEAVASKPM
jgi:predicted metal-binding membrane protein